MRCLRDHQHGHVDDRDRVGGAQLPRQRRRADLDGVVIVEDEVDRSHEIKGNYEQPGQWPTQARFCLEWGFARSVGASHAAPLGGIRQHEQIQTGDKLQGERDHRQEAHRVGVLLLCYGDDVDDDGQCKGHGQPAVALPNPLVPVQCDLLLDSWIVSRLRQPFGVSTPNSPIWLSLRTSRMFSASFAVKGVRVFSIQNKKTLTAEYAKKAAKGAKILNLLSAELLGVFGDQSLPAGKLHGVDAVDASNRLTREQPI
jgi:hypothetical protein